MEGGWRGLRIRSGFMGMVGSWRCRMGDGWYWEGMETVKVGECGVEFGYGCVRVWGEQIPGGGVLSVGFYCIMGLPDACRV